MMPAALHGLAEHGRCLVQGLAMVVASVLAALRFGARASALRGLANAGNDLRRPLGPAKR